MSQSAVNLTPPETLVIQEVPDISMSLVEQVSRYTDFRQAALFSWHPVRNEMLISTRFADSPQVHVVSQPMGSRSQLTFYQDAVRSAAYDPQTGETFVFNQDIGGSEFAQNYRFDLDSGNVTLLTDGRSKNSSGMWSNAGDRIVYTSTRRTGNDNDFYTVNPHEPGSEICIAECVGGGWFPLSWSPDDTSLVVLEYRSVNDSDIWRFDCMTGARVCLTKSDSAAAFGYAEFLSDPAKLLVVTDRDSEFHRLAILNSETQELEFIESGVEWDVDQVSLSDDRCLAAFVTNEDGIGRLHVINLDTFLEIELPTLPEGNISGPLWHSDGTHLAFHCVAASAPADIYAIDFSAFTVERWTKSETGRVDVSLLQEPALIKWTSFDGLQIPGFMYSAPPCFTGQRPVMVVIHGGPESQFRPVYLGRTNYYLNELGVVLIYPNIRGSSGYGKTFLHRDNGHLRHHSYMDIDALLDWIHDQPNLDSNRVMITGGSYGGHMTLAVATRSNDRIACSVDIVGMSNLVTFLENTEGYRQDLRRAEYGDERDPETRRYLESIAPLNHAGNITKPMFIIQGRNDPRVPYTEAVQMAETVRANGTPLWFLMANDEGHGFAKKRNSDYQFYATVEFVKRFLIVGPT